MSRCGAVRALLHRAAGVLSDADRLVLEDHVQGCAACRADRDRLALVRELGEGLPLASIGARGRERAIARALLQGAPREPAPARRVPRWAIAVAACLLAAGVAVAGSTLGGWFRSEPASEPAPAPPPAAATDTEAATATAAAAAAATDTATAADTATATAPRLSAADWLARARREFAAGDHAAAEASALAATRADPRRGQLAEASLVMAECAQARGDLDLALARYAEIADRYADLDAGETAVFAAGRLEARRGRTDAARALFMQYLDRHPAGRFAGDARRELARP